MINKKNKNKLLVAALVFLSFLLDVSPSIKLCRGFCLRSSSCQLKDRRHRFNKITNNMSLKTHVSGLCNLMTADIYTRTCARGLSWVGAILSCEVTACHEPIRMTLRGGATKLMEGGGGQSSTSVHAYSALWQSLMRQNEWCHICVCGSGQDTVLTYFRVDVRVQFFQLGRDAVGLDTSQLEKKKNTAALDFSWPVLICSSTEDGPVRCSVISNRHCWAWSMLSLWEELQTLYRKQHGVADHQIIYRFNRHTGAL